MKRVHGKPPVRLECVEIQHLHTTEKAEQEFVEVVKKEVWSEKKRQCGMRVETRPTE